MELGGFLGLSWSIDEIEDVDVTGSPLAADRLDRFETVDDIQAEFDSIRRRLLDREWHAASRHDRPASEGPWSEM